MYVPTDCFVSTEVWLLKSLFFVFVFGKIVLNGLSLHPQNKTIKSNAVFTQPDREDKGEEEQC